MSGEGYREFREEGDDFEDEEGQHPDSLIFTPTGQNIAGQEHFTQDFAAWDFEHTHCKLEFQPFFLVFPEKSRVPEYVGMRIVCHEHKQAFLKRP